MKMKDAMMERATRQSTHYCVNCAETSARLAEAETREHNARLAAIQNKELADFHFRRAREAEALLRKAYDCVVVDHQHYRLPETEILRRRIDAFLARENERG